LYDYFINRCSDTSKKLFEEFRTFNFEEILESIETAEIVCKTLDINYEVLREKYEKIKKEIKQGFIESISNNHVKPTDIDWDKIKLVSSQFDQFNNIFTTNYDLLLYYVILTLEDEGKKLFSDYFFSYPDEKYNYFDTDYFNKQDILRKRHIYYLHGALFLFKQNFNTCKIKTQKNTFSLLLDEILREIENNNYPILVSEGTSDSKLKTITSDVYLTFCLQEFKNKTRDDNKLVIFGHSLSEQDAHLVEIIDENCKKIAISINTNIDKDKRPTMDELRGELRHKESYFQAKFKKAEISFYDSKTLFNF